MPSLYIMVNYVHMLVDGKNAIYRAIFAGYYDQKFRQTGYDYFVIMVRFISNYITLFNPDCVHIFWDSPRDSVWRRELYPAYKDHRAEKYKDLDIDIKAQLARQTKLSILVFNQLNCRQYFKMCMEADDLIYAFCSLYGDKTVIVSSDQDFRQITRKMGHVSLYNPLSKGQQVDPRPTCDIVIKKSLMGDKSDNISGYYNIGDKRSTVLAENRDKRNEFFDSHKAIAEKGGAPVGDQIFRLNRRLIDLSWCPYIADNCEYVEEKQLGDLKFDIHKIESIISSERIRGLSADLPRYTKLYKNLRS